MLGHHLVDHFHDLRANSMPLISPSPLPLSPSVLLYLLHASSIFPLPLSFPLSLLPFLRPFPLPSLCPSLYLCPLRLPFSLPLLTSPPPLFLPLSPLCPSLHLFPPSAPLSALLSLSPSQYMTGYTISHKPTSNRVSSQ